MQIYKFRVALGEQSLEVLERAGYSKDEIADEMRFGAKERIIELVGELSDKQVQGELFGNENINEDEIGG